MPNTRKIGLISATFMGISAIIGSGWLFTPLLAATISGPAAIYAWIIGAFIILVLGLCFSELASLYPMRGLSAIITTISHNKFFGFPFAIANWLGTVAVIALEADATVQYLVNIFPSFTDILFYNNQLTMHGNICSALLVVVFALINYWGVSILAKTNNVITVLKLFVPICTIIILGYTVFHQDNFTAVQGSFMPYGMTSVIQTILVAGIIVSFNGFQSIISFASEIKNPHKTIPLAITISVLICLIIYILVQIVFIGALPPEMLQKGWHEIHMAAPMVQLLSLVGLQFFTTVIYAGSTITPTGTAINFTGASSRILTAMARKNQVPKWFDKVHPIYKISHRSLFLNTALATAFLFTFSSWSNLAQVLGLLHVLSYITVPIAMLVFRKSIDKNKYKFRMPFGVIICYLLFIIFNYLISYAKIGIVTDMSRMIILCQFIFIVMNIKQEKKLIKQHIFSVALLMLYIISLPMLSYLQGSALSQGRFIFFIVIYSSVILFLLTNVTSTNSLDLNKNRDIATQ